MTKYEYVIDIETDTEITDGELAELEQLVIDYLTPEGTLRVEAGLAFGGTI
jgi:hypothetical protein